MNIMQAETGRVQCGDEKNSKIPNPEKLQAPKLKANIEKTFAIRRWCSEAFRPTLIFRSSGSRADPALMLPVFQRSTSNDLADGARYPRVIPFRFRCRQSTSRCVCNIPCGSPSRASHRQWEQWVTGLVMPRLEKLSALEEAQAARPCQACLRTGIFNPVCFIPELQMLVTLFPYDRSLHNCRSSWATPCAELSRSCCAVWTPPVAGRATPE